MELPEKLKRREKGKKTVLVVKELVLECLEGRVTLSRHIVVIVVVIIAQEGLQNYYTCVLD